MEEIIAEMAKCLCKDYGECEKCILYKGENACTVYDDCITLIQNGYGKIETPKLNDNLIGEEVYCIGCNINGEFVCREEPFNVIGFTSKGIAVWNSGASCVDYYNNGFWFIDYEQAENKLKQLKGE